mgnify:CR=1 FL=1
MPESIEAQNYKMTKKSAVGLLLVALGSLFGRYANSRHYK